MKLHISLPIDCEERKKVLRSYACDVEHQDRAVWICGLWQTAVNFQNLNNLGTVLIKNGEKVTPEI